MEKVFKSTEELLEYLESNGVSIKNEEKAKENIEDYTYYSIINGYKSLFKNENNKYKENVRFEEIFALYAFDRNIKNIYLKYILELETIVKSRIANLFIEKYGAMNYLKRENFAKDLDEKLIRDLIKYINIEVKINKKKHIAVAHYLKKYKDVPFYVVVKVLTLGTISRFYGLMKQGDRNQIGKSFGLRDNVLKVVLIHFTNIRNICAHLDRLFSYQNKMTISFKNIDRNYKTENNITNLYMITEYIKLMLKKQKRIKFEKELKKEFQLLKKSLKSISIKDVKNSMGFIK